MTDGRRGEKGKKKINIKMAATSERLKGKIKSKAIKKDLLFTSIAVAVVWLVDSGLLIRAILAQ